MRLRSLCMAILLVALLAMSASALMSTETITGEYHPEWMGTGMDKSLAELGNSPGRVYGTTVFWSGIGVTESLYFAGDTDAFSAFLAKYAKLKYPALTVQIMASNPERPPVLKIEKPGSGCDGKPVEFDEIHYDWVLTHHLPSPQLSPKVAAGPEKVYLSVWPAKVQWDKVKVPSNVTIKRETPKPVQSGDAPTKP